jgi:hypothetical protein
VYAGDDDDDDDADDLSSSNFPVLIQRILISVLLNACFSGNLITLPLAHNGDAV